MNIRKFAAAAVIGLSANFTAQAAPAPASGVLSLPLAVFSALPVALPTLGAPALNLPAPLALPALPVLSTLPVTLPSLAALPSVPSLAALPTLVPPLALPALPALPIAVPTLPDLILPVFLPGLPSPVTLPPLPVLTAVTSAIPGAQVQSVSRLLGDIRRTVGLSTVPSLPALPLVLITQPINSLSGLPQ